MAERQKGGGEKKINREGSSKYSSRAIKQEKKKQNVFPRTQNKGKEKIKMREKFNSGQKKEREEISEQVRVTELKNVSERDKTMSSASQFAL